MPAAVGGMVLVERAGDALKTEVMQRVWERFKAGDDLSDIAGDEMVQWAIDRYKPNIINGLRRGGLELPEGVEELTPDALRELINEQLELALEALTPEAVADALDARLAKEVSERLGVQITSLRDPEQLQEACIEAVIAAVKSGRANKLISQARIRKFRELAAWASAGIDVRERARLQNIMSQRRWRKRYTWTWEKGGQ